MIIKKKKTEGQTSLPWWAPQVWQLQWSL